MIKVVATYAANGGSVTFWVKDAETAVARLNWWRARAYQVEIGQ